MAGREDTDDRRDEANIMMGWCWTSCYGVGLVCGERRRSCEWTGGMGSHAMGIGRVYGMLYNDMLWSME